MTCRSRLAVASGRLLAVLALLVVAAVRAPEVEATHLGDGVPDETSVSLSFVASADPQLADRVTARLLGYDGKPIGNAEVDFRGQVEFLGTRYVQLGRALTDVAGMAQVSVKSLDAIDGIEASFAGDEQHAPSSASVTIPATASSGQRGSTGFQPPRPDMGLASLAAVMPPLIASAAVGVWVVLAALTLLTIHRIRRASRAGVPEREGGGITSH